jgi:hypothetical protein
VGRAPSVPTTVTTGCGERRPLAATSRTPERVTCLACREHARQAHEAWAAALESTVTAVVAFDPDLAARAGTEARRHRDLAARYRT